MRLSYDQIRSITFGFTKVWEADGVHFQRCTDGQISAWYKLSEPLGQRTQNGCGMCFDFHTDSGHFAFSSHVHGKYDLYVNNMMVYTCRESDYETGSGWYRFDLPAGENRVTLVFPSHGGNGIVIKGVELDDGSSIIAHSFDRKILFLGDSITQGHGSSCDSASYAWRVCRALNAQCVNLAVGGSFYHDTVFPDALEYEPDMVIVAYGTNDWSRMRTMEQLQSHMGSYLDKVCKRFNGKTLIGISPLWRADALEVRPMGSFADARECIKENIRSRGMILVEGETLVPHQKYFFADERLHPNDLGYACYADNLLQQIGKYL